MNQENEFAKAGFSVVGTENNENKLYSFIKENYPHLIRDNELNLEELKVVLGLPVDEKVNGYGLNFVGRNFARAKYAQKTTKELRLNTDLSQDIDKTQNLVLKGDNLDSLKILKNYYSGAIKCIYIDPPYNTDKDEFVYPDKFDKEEAEVLGLANLSENDFARMDFSFKTKKSHNGWLAFMYPRLLLARDLLSEDGVIFISIDDNEQANLKLLCDEIFGEENFVNQFIWVNNLTGRQLSGFGAAGTREFVFAYARNVQNIDEFSAQFNYLKKLMPDTYKSSEKNILVDEKGEYVIGDELKNNNSAFNEVTRPNLVFDIYYRENDGDIKIDSVSNKHIFEGYVKITPHPNANGVNKYHAYRWSRDKILKERDDLEFVKHENTYKIYPKRRNFEISTAKDIITNISTSSGTRDISNLDIVGFSFPKPLNLIEFLLKIATNLNCIILDFFAGSGTTGEAVMRLNAEDGGDRKFILCQIDEPISQDKPAYQFCIAHGLPPVISSITIERLRRAGKKIVQEIEVTNSKSGMFVEDKKQVPDVGFKVFDSTEAPKLQVEENTLQISIVENGLDALSRIYNMIFTVGLDSPTQIPDVVVEDCIYRIGSNYYLTNSEKISRDDFANAIKSGKVFIDGWTASLNGTLQHFKEDIKIVF
jgi:adenine-specific DNA-methyltransferase